MANGNSLEMITNNMAEVAAYSNELNALGQSWDLLTVLGQMSGGNTDMTTTREGFRKLTGDLIEELGTETLRIVIKDITARAKGVISILNRNLFERTADIGFLATDGDIRGCLLAQGHASAHAEEAGDALAAELATRRSNLVRRFEEYVAKYSVYSNIVLLDRDGRVVVQLDQDNPVTQSRDPLIGQALTTDKPYVETFGESDLFPGAGKVLLYSCRVLDPARSSKALGVLCLCFRLHDEMLGIFQRLIPAQDWSVLSLLDEAGRVIVSSDHYQLPLGTQLETAVDVEYKITRLGSQRYLASTIAAPGYQGYSGLGWYGHVMVPLHYAFENREEAGCRQLDQHLLDSLFGNSRIFPEQIRFIPRQADAIQANLDRTVWNGNILSNSQDNHSFKVLLREISNTGAKTKAVFSKAIANLQHKVMTCHLNDVGSLAATAIDIMDRNLYERANDCRWWALTPEFRHLFADKMVAASDVEQLARTLQHLNSLYTVYSMLLVYDRQGRIVATSRPAERHVIGQPIERSWVEKTLGLRSAQQYAVSAFERSPFYDDRATYIYSAPIFSDDHSSVASGGIAVVFDSTPQFSAMLQDCLPRDESGPVSGAFGVFVDARKTVIACSDDRFKAGDQLDIELDFSRLNPRQPFSTLVTLQHQHYAVGIKASTGYREFKSAEDCYSNAVYSLVFMDMGASDTVGKKRGEARGHAQARLRINNDVNGIEIATFSIGTRSFGIKTANIVEALEHTRLAPIPNSPSSVMGTMFYKGKPVLVLNPSKVLGCSLDMSAANLQVVLVSTGKGIAGLLVEHLGEIRRIDQLKVTRDSYPDSHGNGCVEGVVPLDEDDEDSQLLVLIDPDRLVSQLMAA